MVKFQGIENMLLAFLNKMWYSQLCMVILDFYATLRYY